MRGELDALNTERERRRFAIGCLFGALRAPAHPTERARRAMTAAAGALIIVASATTALTVPPTRMFAIAFGSLMAAGLWTTGRLEGAAEPARPAARCTAVVVIAATAGVIGLAIDGTVRFPQAGNDPAGLYSIMFAVVSVLYFVVGLATLTTAFGSRLRFDLSALGVIGAAGAGIMLAVSSMTHGAVAIGLLAGSLSTFIAVVAVSNRKRRDVGQAAHVGLAVGLVAASVAGTTALASLYLRLDAIAADPATLDAFHEYGEPFHDVSTWLVSDQLGATVGLLIGLPLLAIFISTLTAATGTRSGDPRH
jgi:hypothetical protein